MSRLLGWKNMPIGGIIFEPGTSHQYITGGWRTYKPVHAADRCSHCLRCWIFCPDSAVLVENGRVTGFNLDHCKGCGICARECPAKCHAIEMMLDR
jgi:pyruvate ferredoxin oxidoreductase delta subunit